MTKNQMGKELDSHSVSPTIYRRFIKSLPGSACFVFRGLIIQQMVKIVALGLDLAGE